MGKHYHFPSAGWFIVFGSVACMGASLAMAQRAAEPQRTAELQRTAETQRAAEPQQPARNETPDRRAESPRSDIAREIRAGAEGEEYRPQRQLGLTFEGQDDLVVGQVAPGSTAADAGLRPRDRILSIDGRPITGQRRFAAFLSAITGRRVPVVIEREGRQYTVQLMPGDINERGAWLGVYLQDSDQQERGARITQVYPAGPAARAGLRPGDLILRVNDQAVQSTPDLIATVDAMKPQTKVALRIMRGQQEMDATAVLASRDSYIFHQAAYADEGRGGRTFDRESGDDSFSGIPPYAMELEHDRRMAEQHERIETELRKLQEEVRLLRAAIERK
jgi:C-terminal processing protease CtpA/Prc